MGLLVEASAGTRESEHTHIHWLATYAAQWPRGHGLVVGRDRLVTSGLSDQANIRPEKE